MKRIYVAGASSERETLRKYMADLRDAGWTISHDWIAVMDRLGGDETVTPDTARRCALDDLEGVRTCDVFWLVYPDKPSAGAFVELGYALALRKSVIVSGTLRSIFGHLYDLHYRSDLDALAAFVSDARGRST